MTTRTTCPYCGVGCGILAAPDGTVRGDPAHPANQGRLCSKGAALGETLALPERLLHPEVGGRRASWEAALDAVAEGFRRALAAGGPESVGLYVSGQLLTEDYYAANKLAKGFLGTANIDSNSRLCMASAVAAHRRGFGEDLVPGLYADLEQADLVVLVGSNLAWCHPVLHQRLLAARAARPAMRVVVVDPRRTATAEGADLHLALRPGSDVALFAALLAHLAAAGALDAAACAAPGFAETLAAARATATGAAALTGLDPADLATFCRWFAETPRVVTLWSQGVNQSSAGTDKASAILNVHLATGRIGRPGMGPFSVTGQPNAMGGREVGALATTLAAHLEWSHPGDAAALAEFWGAPALPPGPGLTAVPMFQTLAEGRLGALWVMATNPAVSLPDSAAVRDALARAPFLVVSDCSRASDTLPFAHVRLPALAWGEKEGSVTNSERVISRQRAFLPAPGESRADWWIIAQVAARLGFGAAFAWAGPAAIFREHAALSALAARRGRRFDLTGLAGLDDAAYAALEPTRWPCPAPGISGGRLVPEAPRFIPTPFRPPALRPDRRRPVTLLTGRLRDQWHSMTRTGFVPRLMAGAPEPVLTLHPADAPAEAGQIVAVSGLGAPALLRLALDPGQPRGTAFLPMHGTDRFAPQGRSNGLMEAAIDPASAQPELKHAPVSVSPWPAAWHGFALGGRVLPPGSAPYMASAPLAGGTWRQELAGTEPPAEAAARLRALLEEPGTAWRLLEDPAAGVHRAVLLRGGALHAALFLAPTPDLLPARDWLAGLLGQPADAAARRALLAGAVPGGPPASPTLCACHGVSRAAIEAAIAAGAASVEAVGTACAAGTGCGACRPEIGALLPCLVQAA